MMGLARGIFADIAASSAAVGAVTAGSDALNVPPPEGVDPIMWGLMLAVLTAGSRLAIYVVGRWLDKRKGGDK